MAITVEVPREMEAQLRQEYHDVGRRILEGFAAEAFRRGELSSGQVGKLLGMSSRWDAITFLSEGGVYPGYDVDDFAQDLRNLAELGWSKRDDCCL